ncbi:hypothetical protein I4F81_008436 [Pyropia yezoensis]|uniref:Uncharacterized protein n=1 Tax=Pyropia yezoensis TaxID=2788 RepID=A0ACC3C7I5_PYRYE|nr:hypothetical protein I4F81_008436 [Neopyropia yezoensis]
MGQDHEVKMAALEQVKAGDLTTAAFARRVEYVSSLSLRRQETARRYFHGTTTPGKRFMTIFLKRWRELREYRAGTIEAGRARNARPETVAHWYATLSLMYCDLRFVSPRQVWNMDDTHIKARESAGNSRARILGPVGMTKPEVVMPDFASGAGACTAAFTVSAAGTVAPHFIVVEGATPDHAFVRVTDPHGKVCTVPLASFLNDSAVAWRRTPPGFDKSVFDVYAEHIATFLRSYYPKEAKLLAVNGAKVHLSPGGLLTLLRANVRVIAEPSKMSHILEALDTPSAFGRYQPKVRSRVQELALACRADSRPFTTIELDKSIGRAASDALTVDALVSAFRRVGMWPLDPTVVSWEDLCKGADEPLAPYVDIPLLVSRPAPVARKDMARPVVQNGTLSTAGRATILTAPEVISALNEMDADKEE